MSCKIVAEISANHCQKFEKAVQLVLAAKFADADAVKVQMFTPDLGSDEFIKTGLWRGWTLKKLYEKACMPYDWVPKLKDIAEELGLFFFTSVYDEETVDIAEEMGIMAYKIASQEILYTPLIEKAAKTGKTVILSAGMATYPELYKAVSLVRNHTKDLYVLHCVSEYPALPDEMNLRTITDISRHPCKAGISDHTIGITIPIAAVCHNAQMIEKHLKIDDQGLDAVFSIDPYEFKEMVQAVRDTEKAIGKVNYGGTKKFLRMCENGKWIRKA